MKEIAEDRMRMYHGVSHFYSYREGEEIVRWKGEYYHASDIKRKSGAIRVLPVAHVPLRLHIAVNGGIHEDIN